jgi:uncharacterized protein
VPAEPDEARPPIAGSLELVQEANQLSAEAVVFEWSEAKRLDNLQKHGADFREAALIFCNDFIEQQDGRSDYGEEHYRALWHVEKDNFVVVYTWRGRKGRIISAWKVNEDGKRRYEDILSRNS